MNKSYTRAIGGNTHALRQENDYYATPPRAIDDLLNKVVLSHHIWEPACGGGHLSRRLSELGYQVYSTDLVDRNYPYMDKQLNFLEAVQSFDGDIVTNPPYRYAKDFVLKSLSLIPDNRRVCMFLKLQFLEGQARYKELFSQQNLKYVFVYSKRITTAKNGDFDTYHSTTAFAHAWFVWEKGYAGKPTIDWI